MPQSDQTGSISHVTLIAFLQNCCLCPCILFCLEGIFLKENKNLSDVTQIRILGKLKCFSPLGAPCRNKLISKCA